MSPPSLEALVAVTLPVTSMIAFATSDFETEAMNTLPAVVLPPTLIGVLESVPPLRPAGTSKSGRM